jgi:hypothetical protein
LIAREIRLDTRKLASTEAFSKSLDEKTAEDTVGSRPGISLKAFAEQRRAYLLNHSSMKNLPSASPSGQPEGTTAVGTPQPPLHDPDT